MSTNPQDERLAALIDQHLDNHLSDEADPERPEITELLDLADLIREAAHGAPVLENDPAAALLGLVPDAGYRLDGKKLSAARKREGSNVSQLATALAKRGWSVSAGDVFRWENRSAEDVSPALIRAIAESLGQDPDSLASAAEPGSTFISSLRGSPAFQALAERWARARNVTAGLAAATLESRTLATVHRGEAPDLDQALTALEQLVSTVEAQRQDLQ